MAWFKSLHGVMFDYSDWKLNDDQHISAYRILVDILGSQSKDFMKNFTDLNNLYFIDCSLDYLPYPDIPESGPERKDSLILGLEIDDTNTSGAPLLSSIPTHTWGTHLGSSLKQLHRFATYINELNKKNIFLNDFKTYELTFNIIINSLADQYGVNEPSDTAFGYIKDDGVIGHLPNSSVDQFADLVFERYKQIPKKDFYFDLDVSGNYKTWHESLKNDSITSWNDLKEE